MAKLVGDTQIDGLVSAVMDAFGEAGRKEFLKLCAAVSPGIQHEVNLDQGFKPLAEGIFVFLNGGGLVPPLLPGLLRGRPGDATLRKVVGSIDSAALEAVPEARFAVEKAIAAHLNGADAQALRESVSRSDDIRVAVTAYKTMHDTLHLMQPLMPMIRQFATVPSTWPQLRLHLPYFRLQLDSIDAALARLQATGRGARVPWRTSLGEELDELEKVLGSTNEGAVFDSVSLFAGAVSEGLDSVDLQMLNLVEEAAQPLEQSLKILAALRAEVPGSEIDALAASYADFAAGMSAQLKETIEEHTCWQALDLQFEELQRLVVNGQLNAAVNIDSLWRIVTRKLEKLCGGPPPHPWALTLADRLGRLTIELKPPINPPVPDAARDGVSELISQGRRRFMEIDRKLLDWLEQSVERRPDLSTLLRGGEERDG